MSERVTQEAVKENVIDLYKLYRIAFENKVKVIAIIVVCIIASVIVEMFVPKEYQSTALMRFKPVSNTLITGSMNTGSSNGVDLSNTDMKNISTTECIQLMKSKSFKNLVNEKSGIDNAGNKLFVQDVKIHY